MLDHILVCDGASASSRESSDKIANVVKNAVNLDIRKYIFAEIEHTLWEESTEAKLSRYFRRLVKGSKVTVVAKSQGAWRALDHLRKNEYSGIDIRVISVDPHHWADRIRKIFNRPAIRVASVLCVNFFQKSHWPQGCIVRGAENYVVVNRNHWDIIHDEAVSHKIKEWLCR